MFYQRNQSNCDPNHVRYLEYELEQAREDERRRQEEADRRREERQRERKQEWEWEQRHAGSWPEALRKQASLFRREANDWPASDPDFPIDPDTFFGPGADACERALEIWKEVEVAKKEQIAALEAQIQALRDSIRFEVSEKLEAEAVGKPQGWRHVAIAIRQDADPNRWLDW